MLETPTRQSDGETAGDETPVSSSASRPRPDEPGSFWAAVAAVREQFPERMRDYEWDRIDMLGWPGVPDFTSERFGGYDENGEPVVD